MPVKRLPAHPNLDHLKHQAKDLLKDHAARDRAAAQRLREFHPRFASTSDDEIFKAHLILSDAQLTVAREHGFASWPRLKAHIEMPTLADRLEKPHHERIEDPDLRRAVELLDAGDAEGLRSHLEQHSTLVHQHVAFEGGNYFRNPTLLEFVAENPVRRGRLPQNILAITRVILDAGPEPDARNQALTLVSTGRVPRECGAQLPLIDLLCDRGADPATAIHAAALHGEFAAVDALVHRGAPIDLPIAAALGRADDFSRLLPQANKQERHLALALASQFGHVEIAALLLDAGEDPNRYNPIGAHSHSTPLHQAAGGGFEPLVRLLVARGARVDIRDVLWHGTPADWASHAGHTEVEAYLRARDLDPKSGLG
jgi:hypothetical protein